MYNRSEVENSACRWEADARRQLSIGIVHVGTVIATVTYGGRLLLRLINKLKSIRQRALRYIAEAAPRIPVMKEPCLLQYLPIGTVHVRIVIATVTYDRRLLL